MYQNYYFTDASTKKNGQPDQDSTILVTDEMGTVVFEKHLGDYTINEAELLGIIACFKVLSPGKKIKVTTDSQIVANWLNYNEFVYAKKIKSKKWKATPRSKNGWLKQGSGKTTLTQ